MIRERYTEESWQRVLDAAKRGNETRKLNLKKIELEYFKNPKKCKQCGNPIPYLKRLRYNFCNRTCSAIYNNLKRGSLKSVFIPENSTKQYSGKYCLKCGFPIKKGSKKYCSHKCEIEDKSEKRLEKMLLPFNNGELTDEQSRRFFREITTEKKCSICGITEWTGQSVPLVVDHVDGNHNNDLPSNLRFVCCNCDALLPTFKAKNKGNGRTYRRL